MAAVEQAPEDEAVVFTSVTPAGIEISYSPAPRRYYAVRQPVSPFESDAELEEMGWTKGGERTHKWAFSDWTEVPSVTTVLGCLEKGGLSWWGQGVAVRGVLELVRRGVIAQAYAPPSEPPVGGLWMVDAAGGQVDAEDVVKFLTENRLTVNHTLSAAGDRGTSVHDAFEQFFKTGQRPHPEIYPDTERGYIRGLLNFVDDFEKGGIAYPKTEITVGSVEHGYAGRFDLRCDFNGGELVTKSYPKRQDKRENVSAGKYLLDLKTSSGTYPSQEIQLEAYELASVECGYGPTDGRAIVHVTADGRYEFVRSRATSDDFLAVKGAYDALARVKRGAR